MVIVRLSRVSKIRKIKDNQTYKEVLVLDNIDLEVNSKEIFVIVGPSGGGKSTLLRLINRLEEITSGSIFIDDQNINQMDVIELRKKVGMVFQVPVMFDGSVKGNITYGINPSEKDQDLSDLSQRCIELVGLDERFSNRDANQLSVGEKQRVSIARALAVNPEILLLDEPTSALDPQATSNIENLILDLNSKIGLTIIFVTHNMSQALRIGKRGMLLVNGKKIEEGRFPDLFSRPTNDITQKFVQGFLT